MKLKIHSWGGLGSQLHALSLTHDLKQKFPRRKLILIHHTSGVSRRLFESDIFLDKGIELRVVDDYKYRKGIDTGKKLYLNKSIRSLVKYILNIFSISVDIDRKYPSRIRFWTMELRGHYSKLEVNENFMKLCVKSLSAEDSSNTENQDALIIHYRLGDLLSLVEKSIISPKKIVNEVKKVSKLYKFKQVIVFSDSVGVAKQKLSDLNSIYDQIRYSDAPTIEVMEYAIGGNFFIGTNSKVSFWIENFRRSIGKPSSIIHTNNT
jgi:hypothetical protein